MSNKKRRTEQVAQQIKNWIEEHHLKPGDRLPNEVDVMQTLGASKSTVRESMRLLDAQGLLVTKTGPKGGVFVSEVSEAKATMLVSNYFFFKKMTIADIYQIRCSLEPELAASLAGKLSQVQLNQLRDQISLYLSPPLTLEEEKIHHIASIEFHRILASFSDNELLMFIIRFTAQLLSELTINRHLYEPKNFDLWRKGVDHQLDLLHALASGDEQRARLTMRTHMEHARMIMRLHEVDMQRRFIEG